MATYSSTKFDSAETEALYEVSLDGGPDEEIGSVDEQGWYGLMREERCILHEDSQGFVDGTWFDTKDELEQAWAELCAELSEDDDDAS